MTSLDAGALSALAASSTEPPHAWLNDNIFLATGRRMPNDVQIPFFRVL